MQEKHRNFVQAYLQCFDAAEAARRAQCGADALARPAVRRELAAQRSRGVPGREDALRRLAQIAFGRANDCVRLVLEDDPPIGELDLTLLSEVKRNDKGTVEIKLVDRLRALEQLLDAVSDEGDLADAFFAAAGDVETA